MSEDDDLHDHDNEGRFPLSITDKPKIEKVIELVRDHLPTMSPSDLRPGNERIGFVLPKSWSRL